jgi:hypothetical protein
VQILWKDHPSRTSLLLLYFPQLKRIKIRHRFSAIKIRHRFGAIIFRLTLLPACDPMSTKEGCQSRAIRREKETRDHANHAPTPSTSSTFLKSPHPLVASFPDATDMAELGRKISWGRLRTQFVPLPRPCPRLPPAAVTSSPPFVHLPPRPP